MENNWVDFKAVKSAVSMQMLLDRYQINWLRKSGGELRGRCPIHKGDGQDAFHVNVTKNAFNCFSCHTRGNVLDFVAAMEQCSVRDAGLKLKEWFAVTGDPATLSAKAPEADRPASVGESGAVINPPLKFQLKGIDSSHAYLAERGVNKAAAESFGVGFFAGKGSMNGRAVIPIHNEHGELVAYAGRSIDGSEPRYKLPAGFHKSVELFNLHRTIGESNPERQVVVVEGFFDCIKMSDAGFPCVALMGCSMSEAQEELLVRHFQAAWLVLDGDEPGRQAAVDCMARLGRRMWVRVAVLPDGKQPDQLNREEIKSLLEPYM